MAAEVKSSTATEPKVTRPEKPDDEAYKAALATAEKEHAAVLEKLVRQLLLNDFSPAAGVHLHLRHCPDLRRKPCSLREC